VPSRSSLNGGGGSNRVLKAPTYTLTGAGRIDMSEYRTGHAHVSADSLAPPPIRAPDLEASTTALATALLTFSSNTLGTM